MRISPRGLEFIRKISPLWMGEDFPGGVDITMFLENLPSGMGEANSQGVDFYVHSSLPPLSLLFTCYDYTHTVINIVFCFFQVFS